MEFREQYLRRFTRTKLNTETILSIQSVCDASIPSTRREVRGCASPRLQRLSQRCSISTPSGPRLVSCHTGTGDQPRVWTDCFATLGNRWPRMCRSSLSPVASQSALSTLLLITIEYAFIFYVHFLDFGRRLCNG